MDEAELCGSPGWCYLRNQKAKYTAEPPDISIELTIVSKYHHGGRLRKAIPYFQPSVPLADLLLCFTRFRLREYSPCPCCPVIQSRKQI